MKNPESTDWISESVTLSGGKSLLSWSKQQGLRIQLWLAGGEPSEIIIGNWAQGIDIKANYAYMQAIKIDPITYWLGSPAHLIEKHLEKVFSHLLRCNALPVQSWREEIPLCCRRNALRCPDQLGLRVLRLAAQYEVAQQLLQSHPCLLWLIAAHSRQMQWSPHELNYCFRGKRIDMLSLLGFEPRNSALTILGKLSLKALPANFLDLVSNWLKHPQLADLVHYPVLSANHLILFRLCPEMIGSRWSFNIEAVQSIEAIEALGHTLADCVSMATQLNRLADFRQQLRQVNSHERFEAIHQTLAQAVQIERKLGMEMTYPRPPIPGIQGIEPITQSTELLLEGQQQDNCVFSYHDKIFNGDYYVYKITIPQRATLGIEIADGEIHFDQLYLRQNQPVSDATRSRVHRWLQDFKLHSQDSNRCVMTEWKTARLDQIYTLESTYRKYLSGSNESQ